MAPRKKKPRLSSHPASTASNVQPTPTATPSPSKTDEMSPSKSGFTLSPWTDEQETALFKGMVQWKPVGMHKHFRMLSISNHLTTHGHVHPSLAPHLRMPGIWEKLRELYDLEALDEREDAFPVTPDSEEPPLTDPITEHPFTEFTLPFSEYGSEMLERALNTDGAEQEDDSPHVTRPQSSRRGRRHNTIKDSTVDEGQEQTSPEPADGQAMRQGKRGSRSLKRSEPAKAIAGKAERQVDEKVSTRRSGRKR